MFVRRLIRKPTLQPAETAPAGALRPEQLNPRLVAHHGVPSSASILAYEPVQRLLAVGTRIGQIKVFGGQGVEALLQSSNKAPCRLLEFVPNRGRLIQITTRNDVEVWDLFKQELVASTTWETDVTALTVAVASPYFYIGEETGNMHVMRFDEDQQHLQAQPYFVPAHATLDGLIKPGSMSAPALVGILPQPHAVHDRSFPHHSQAPYVVNFKLALEG